MNLLDTVTDLWLDNDMFNHSIHSTFTKAIEVATTLTNITGRRFAVRCDFGRTYGVAHYVVVGV
jgi:hypothetical protein